MYHACIRHGPMTLSFGNHAMQAFANVAEQQAGGVPVDATPLPVPTTPTLPPAPPAVLTSACPYVSANKLSGAETGIRAGAAVLLLIASTQAGAVRILCRASSILCLALVSSVLCVKLWCGYGLPKLATQAYNPCACPTDTTNGGQSNTSAASEPSGPAVSAARAASTAPPSFARLYNQVTSIGASHWHQVALTVAVRDYTVLPGQSSPRTQQPGPCYATRAQAIVHIAMYNAFAGVDGSGEVYRFDGLPSRPPPRFSSPGVSTRDTTSPACAGSTTCSTWQHQQ